MRPLRAERKREEAPDSGCAASGDAEARDAGGGDAPGEPYPTSALIL